MSAAPVPTSLISASSHTNLTLGLFFVLKLFSSPSLVHVTTVSSLEGCSVPKVLSTSHHASLKFLFHKAVRVILLKHKVDEVTLVLKSLQWLHITLKIKSKHLILAYNFMFSADLILYLSQPCSLHYSQALHL